MVLFQLIFLKFESVEYFQIFKLVLCWCEKRLCYFDFDVALETFLASFSYFSMRNFLKYVWFDQSSAAWWFNALAMFGS
jgi:hypothetical protein